MITARLYARALLHKYSYTYAPEVLVERCNTLLRHHLVVPVHCDAYSKMHQLVSIVFKEVFTASGYVLVAFLNIETRQRLNDYKVQK